MSDTYAPRSVPSFALEARSLRRLELLFESAEPEIDVIAKLCAVSIHLSIKQGTSYSACVKASYGRFRREAMPGRWSHVLVGGRIS
jgi:hypothetical protein